MHKRKTSYSRALAEAKKELDSALRELDKTKKRVAELTTDIPQLYEVVASLCKKCGENPPEKPAAAQLLVGQVTTGTEDSQDDKPLTEADLPPCRHPGCKLPYAHTHESPDMVRRIVLPPAEAKPIDSNKMQAVIDDDKGWS